jgi:amidohydrolase
MQDFHDWFDCHQAEIVGWRHDLHAHPELAFQERRTAGFVADHLTSWGLQVVTGIAQTGVVATLPGGDGPAIGLRADMDALPIEEMNQHPYRSRHGGCMHACGHDGHTVMLLTAARYLAGHHERRGKPPGPIHFIFQPAEEDHGGGRRMVEEGLFQRFPVECVFAMHNFPGLPVGHFMTRTGPMTAGFDVFDIVVEAPGGHGALPATGGDALLAAAALATTAQSIVPRHVAADQAVVLAITQLHGGSAYNILPDKVRISGSVRWLDRASRDEIRRRLELHCAGLGVAYGVAIGLDYQPRYPAVVNDPAQTALAVRAARGISGHVIADAPAVMGSEDFAFLLEAAPGALLGIGNGLAGQKGGCGLHNPHYDFNDAALRPGAAFWVALTRRFFAERAVQTGG